MQKESIEIWKAVPNYEDYEVSDLGNVRSLKFGKTKLLKLRIGTSGYFQVIFSKNGKIKGFTVHSLIYTTFKGEIPPGMTVDHIDGCKFNNRPENLQLLSNADNARKGNLGRTPWNKGKKCNPLTAEHRAKIGASQKGRTPWNKGKPTWNKGKKCSPLSAEHKAKLSAAAKAYYERKQSGIICI